MTATGPQSIGTQGERFFEMMVAERGASTNTQAAYRRDLVDVASFISRRGGELAQATTEDLRAYLAALNRSGASTRTPSSDCRPMSIVARAWTNGTTALAGIILT